MENCLKRRDLDSDSELDDTEDSDLDNDIESSVLPGDRFYHHVDYDTGLISPYKRLRVEDLAQHSSAESHAGEEEAHSLLRSIDGDMSWSKLSFAKSQSEFGQLSKSDSPTKTSGVETSVGDAAGLSSFSSPRRQLVKRGTSVDEELRRLAAETREREFPLPPAIDGRKHNATLNKESDSLLLASYHPDYQTLESRQILYHSLDLSALKSPVSRQNSGSNTRDTFDLLEIHTGSDSIADERIYEEMLSEKDLPLAGRPDPFRTEASSTSSNTSTKVTSLEDNESHSKSVGISTNDLPTRVSPLPVGSSQASTLASSSQRETNSDGVSAVYDSVDSEPEATSWPSARFDRGSEPEGAPWPSTKFDRGSEPEGESWPPARFDRDSEPGGAFWPSTKFNGGSFSCLPKITMASGVGTSEVQDMNNYPDSNSQLRYPPGDVLPSSIMSQGMNPPPAHTQAIKSLSWNDICQQYQQHLQYQLAAESLPHSKPQAHQQTQQYQVPFGSLGPPPTRDEYLAQAPFRPLGPPAARDEYLAQAPFRPSGPPAARDEYLAQAPFRPSGPPAARDEYLAQAPFRPLGPPAARDEYQSVGSMEMLSYLGYPSKYRHSSQRSLQSHSSQDSGRVPRSSNSRSSQESIEHIEKSYPSSLVISENKSKKAFLQSPGHLKLSAYWNVGLLTVHVIQARCLSSSWAKHCDSYVKMSLVPDESRRTRCKTRVLIGSNNPVFDEKFSMEILEEDRRKRLLISVWHKDPSNGADQEEFEQLHLSRV